MFLGPHENVSLGPAVALDGPAYNKILIAYFICVLRCLYVFVFGYSVCRLMHSCTIRIRQ